MKRVSALLIAVTVVLLIIPIKSQQGAWVEYNGDIIFGTGARLYDAGGSCTGFAYEYTSKIVCFDVNSEAWHDLEFQTNINLDYLKAEGHIVFAFGDTYIVGYNSLTANFDTLQFAGTPLSLTGIEIGRSYKVGKNLALFVTDEKMYVFDAYRDGWQEYEYTLPVDYSYGRYWIKDDYAGVILSGAGSNPPTNIAYSLSLGEFAETSTGAFWNEDYMSFEKGFAGFYSTGTGDPSHIVGYSSSTGQFDITTLSGDYQIGAGWINTSDYVDSYTVCAFAARILITPSVLVRFEMYGFNTATGNWTHTTLDVNPQESSEPSGWRLGGKYADTYIVNEDLSKTFLFYNGYTESFETYTPGISYYHSFIWLEGGSVFAQSDNQNVWVHDFSNGNSSMQSFNRLYNGNMVAGEKYIAFVRDDNSDTSTAYFWQGDLNDWIIEDLTFAASENAGSHVYALATSGYGDPVRAMFYSPITNVVATGVFTGNVWPSALSNKYLAAINSSEQSFMFDANTGVIQTMNYNIGNNIGIHCAIAKQSTSNILYGYSTLTGTSSEITTDETPFAVDAIDYVGLAHQSYSYTKYFAYNAIYGTWIELTPTGNHTAATCGEKTIIVVRSNALYAFDPEGIVSDIEAEQSLLPKTISLSQNYPNPFNGSTIISYSLSKPTNVEIEIFDILGRKVANFDRGFERAGTHKLVWNAADQASGVYFYKISADDIEQTRQMVLLK